MSKKQNPVPPNTSNPLLYNPPMPKTNEEKVDAWFALIKEDLKNPYEVTNYIKNATESHDKIEKSANRYTPQGRTEHDYFEMCLTKLQDVAKAKDNAKPSIADPKSDAQKAVAAQIDQWKTDSKELPWKEGAFMDLEARRGDAQARITEARSKFSKGDKTAETELTYWTSYYDGLTPFVEDIRGNAKTIYNQKVIPGDEERKLIDEHNKEWWDSPNNPDSPNYPGNKDNTWMILLGIGGAAVIVIIAAVVF